MLHQRLYQQYKSILGESLTTVAKETMHNAQEEEKIFAERNYPSCKIEPPKYGKVVNLVMRFDIVWIKHSSRRCYDSTSGTCFILGSNKKKIHLSAILVCQCMICDKHKEKKKN